MKPLPTRRRTPRHVRPPLPLPEGLRVFSPTELSQLAGVSLVTLWRLRKIGELLAPVRISPGRIAWRSDVIERWLASRAAVPNADGVPHGVSG